MALPKKMLKTKKTDTAPISPWTALLISLVASAGVAGLAALGAVIGVSLLSDFGYHPMLASLKTMTQLFAVGGAITGFPLYAMSLFSGTRRGDLFRSKHPRVLEGSVRASFAFMSAGPYVGCAILGLMNPQMLIYSYAAYGAVVGVLLVAFAGIVTLGYLGGKLFDYLLSKALARSELKEAAKTPAPTLRSGLQASQQLEQRQQKGSAPVLLSSQAKQVTGADNKGNSNAAPAAAQLPSSTASVPASALV